MLWERLKRVRMGGVDRERGRGKERGGGRAHTLI